MRRRAFTLVELLVTISIIGIVALFALGAFAGSAAKAKREKTRGLIARIEGVVIDQWESYRTRRLPLQMGIARDGSVINPDGNGRSQETVQQFAARQLIAKRELMRMELPDRYSDIMDAPAALKTPPALSNAYKRRCQAATNRSGRYQDAECLYLIIALARGEEAKELLHRNSGDKDGDGMPEIHDGWGNPIRWLRWPAGYLNDDPTGTKGWGGTITDMHAGNAVAGGDAVGSHDPFDQRKIDKQAYALYPLVYSAGPDGVEDIVADFENPNEVHYNAHNNPYIADAGNRLGQPHDFDGDGWNHFDNIHNHLTQP